MANQTQPPQLKEDVAELTHSFAQRLAAKYMLLEGRVGDIETYLDNASRTIEGHLVDLIAWAWRDNQRYRRIHQQLQEKRKGITR